MRIEAYINIDIPEGYEYVAFGIVPHDGMYLHHNTMKPMKFNSSAPPSGPRIIVKKKPTYRRVEMTDLKPGRSVTVYHSRTRKKFILVGWIGPYALVHDPSDPLPMNICNCDPSDLIIGDDQ